jgi:hypothetical protein
MHVYGRAAQYELQTAIQGITKRHLLLNKRQILCDIQEAISLIIPQTCIGYPIDNPEAAYLPRDPHNLAIYMYVRALYHLLQEQHDRDCAPFLPTEQLPPNCEVVRTGFTAVNSRPSAPNDNCLYLLYIYLHRRQYYTKFLDEVQDISSDFFTLKEATAKIVLQRCQHITMKVIWTVDRQLHQWLADLAQISNKSDTQPPTHPPLLPPHLTHTFPLPTLSLCHPICAFIPMELTISRPDPPIPSYSLARTALALAPTGCPQTQAPQQKAIAVSTANPTESHHTGGERSTGTTNRAYSTGQLLPSSRRNQHSHVT